MRCPQDPDLPVVIHNYLVPPSQKLPAIREGIDIADCLTCGHQSSLHQPFLDDGLLHRHFKTEVPVLSFGGTYGAHLGDLKWGRSHREKGLMMKQGR